VKVWAKSLGALLVLTLMVVVGWRAASVPLALGSAAATAAVAHVNAPVMWPALPASEAPASAASAPPAAVTTPRADGSIDLCGVARMPLPPAMAASARELGAAGAATVLPGPLGEDAVNDARARVLPIMSAAGPRGRAAALLWSTNETDELVTSARRSNDAAIVGLTLSRCAANDAGHAKCIHSAPAFGLCCG
jgi:hypothetical protein